MTALRGVNLGGWLVLERWMTPGVFEGAQARDERGLVRELGLEVARERLERHRSSFITEKDFEFIKAQGMDFVRLPVGYWLFQEVEGYISGQDYVDRAFTWAQKHNLGVVLDLHGLPGSQNGKIHSGEVDRIEFYQPDNIKKGVESVGHLARRYGRQPALIGLQVINEPYVRLCARRLLQFYDEAYKVADKWLAQDVKVVFSDAFMPRRMAWLLARREYDALGKNRLVMDVHLYQLFGSKFQDWGLDRHIEYAERRVELLNKLATNMPIMVGEWSGGLPGRARQGQPDAEKKFIEIQQKIYDENAWAHCYWSYKKTGGGAWNWRTTLHGN